MKTNEITIGETMSEESYKYYVSSLNTKGEEVIRVTLATEVEALKDVSKRIKNNDTEVRFLVGIFGSIAWIQHFDYKKDTGFFKVNLTAFPHTEAELNKKLEGILNEKNEYIKRVGGT